MILSVRRMEERKSSRSQAVGVAPLEVAPVYKFRLWQNSSSEEVAGFLLKTVFGKEKIPKRGLG